MWAPITADSPSVMRQLNLAVILDEIRSAGPISRPQLAKQTGLSVPTVTNAVETLLAKDFIEEMESSDPHRPGPRAKLLTFRATHGYIMGIDVGAHSAVAAVADLAANVLALKRIVNKNSESGIPHKQDVLGSIRQAAREALTEAGVSASDLHAITIGTPGVVSPEDGTLSLAPQIMGWEGINLASELADLADCPIVTENESQLSLLAEQWRGNAAHYKDVVYVQLGIGIGSAYLVDGKIIRGNRGAAGEIAYMLTGEEEVGTPPQHDVGTFEWFAGGQAYRRHGIRAINDEPDGLIAKMVDGDSSKVTAQVIFEAATTGDKRAKSIVQILLKRFARGVSNITTITNPELLLIGGGITKAGPVVADSIREVLNAHTPFPPEVKLTELGDEGTVIGAVRRSMQVADEINFSFVLSEKRK
ncbi:MAG: ROK family transcriptional regulator [Microbacteriaceae bacterium]|nr:ROK family transcriptional regulator [Microbacteriaceae bacterium]